MKVESIKFTYMTVLAFAAFLTIPKLLGYATGTSFSVPDVRPSFWLNPFLEWLVFVAVICWIISLSVYLVKGKPHPAGAVPQPR
jgi:membrane protein DedA with SNARE-associated domain